MAHKYWEFDTQNRSKYESENCNADWKSEMCLLFSSLSACSVLSVGIICFVTICPFHFKYFITNPDRSSFWPFLLKTFSDFLISKEILFSSWSLVDISVAHIRGNTIISMLIIWSGNVDRCRLRAGRLRSLCGYLFVTGHREVSRVRSK